MAISVGKKMSELVKMADSLGIGIPKREDGKRLKKEDYILPIREYNLIQRYGNLNNIPKHLSMVMKLKSPMLAGRIDNFKPEQQKEVWDSEEWDMEEKLNGVRCFIVYDGDTIQLYSRHNSEIDLLPITFTDNVLFPIGFDADKVSKEFILDCEMTSDSPNICTVMDSYGVETESQLQAVTAILGSLPERAREIQKKNNIYLTFNCFDCIYYDKQWLLNEPLVKRREVAEELIHFLKSIGFNICGVAHTNKNKREFFKSIIRRDFEGTVAKRLDGIYIPDTTRNFKGWVKCKKSAMSYVNAVKAEDYGIDLDEMFTGDIQVDGLEDIRFGDTIDAFISGYEPGSVGTSFEGLVGSVAVSVYIEKKDGTLEPREIGKFSGILLSLRREMTDTIDGEPVLRPEFYNRVCEVDGMGLSARNMRLNHCQFLGFRQDKSPSDCVLKEEDFLHMVNY